MVAAGSMVAAVEGLQMRMVGNALMSQKLTEQLAQTIKSDPVGTSVRDILSTGYIHTRTGTVFDFQIYLISFFSGLSQGVSGTNRVAAGNQSQTGTTTATLGYHGS